MFSISKTKVILFILSFITSIFAFSFVYTHSTEGWGKYHPLSSRQTSYDTETTVAFIKNNKPSIEEYDTLVLYFMHGFISSSTHDYSLIHYAGLPGMAGYTVNGLEGFARTSPLFAAWIYSGRPAKVVDPQTGKLVDLIDVLRRGILSGTDPLSQNYWGDIKSNDQRILETADISRLLWLTKEPIWFKLSDIERKKVADWLLQVNNAKITNRNNWILSPIIVNSFLKSVGYEKRCRLFCLF